MRRESEDRELDFYERVVAELRQPLTTVSGHAQLAKQHLRTEPDRASEALDRVVAEIGRMKMMLGELRDRARDDDHAEALFKV